LGLHASHTHAVAFEDCFVAAGQVVGEVGGGFPIAMQLLNAGRIGIAAQAIGIAQGALDASSSYALRRKQFGKRISEFQAIQWKLADMATDISAAKLLMWNAARLKDEGSDFAQAASQAKLFASAVAMRCASDAVQIHGGSGYMREVGVERFYRDAKATEIYEGTSEIQRMVIARNLLRTTERANQNN
jgi:alkylation response protein AidB-like acyl-CoA dehydrogenase